MEITNKFIKFLVILNGTLLPILLFFALYQIAKEMAPKKRKQQPQGVIVGKKLKEAKKDSVALQGLKYHSPYEIYNSENQLLEVSLMSYDKAKMLNGYISKSNDYAGNFSNYVNVIFLDKDYNVIGSLLDKKASIDKIYFKQRVYNETEEEKDKTYKNIAYLIGFEDTNKDGKLNFKDHHDLYLSDLSGKNLKKITHNIDIDKSEFINSNSQIFIHYKEREDTPEEHKKVKFAIYDIKKERFIELKGLNTELDKLEKIIIN